MFSVFTGKGKNKVHHFAENGKTFCGISLGVGSGVERDGSMGGNKCLRCMNTLKERDTK